MKVRERASAVLVGVERDTLRGKVMGEKGEEKYLLKPTVSPLRTDSNRPLFCRDSDP